MYENIGRKIKDLGKIIFSAGATISIFFALVFIIFGFISGVIFLLVGPLVSLISSWLIYGFGELIEKVSEIAENTKTQSNFTISNKEIYRKNIINSESHSSSSAQSPVMNIPKRKKEDSAE